MKVEKLADAKMSSGYSLQEEMLLQALKRQEFTTVRKWIVHNLDNDPIRIYRLIYDSLYDCLDHSTIPHAVLVLAEYSYKSAFVADQEINMLACMTELMGQVKFK